MGPLEGPGSTPDLTPKSFAGPQGPRDRPGEDLSSIRAAFNHRRVFLRQSRDRFLQHWAAMLMASPGTPAGHDAKHVRFDRFLIR